MPEATPPIVYPRVLIDGVSYAVKFGLGAAFRLERYGMNATQLKSDITAEVAAGRNVQLICKLAAAGLGNPTPDGHWIPVSFSPEQIADMVPEKDFGALAEAITQAMLKVSPAPAPKPMAAPIAEEPGQAPN